LKGKKNLNKRRRESLLAALGLFSALTRQSHRGKGGYLKGEKKGKSRENENCCQVALEGGKEGRARE